MEVFRTRIVLLHVSSVILASGFGLTASPLPETAGRGDSR
jgi:hypothetical protein